MNKLAALIPLALVAAACVDTDESVLEPEPIDGDVPIFAGPLDGRENNGPYLLGEEPDALGITNGRHFRVKTSAMRLGVGVTILTDDNRLLSGAHLGADPWFDGVIFVEEGGGTGRLRIDAVTAAPLAWQAYYLLSYRTAPGAPWVPYCTNNAPAIPISGAYSPSDARQPDSAITFSCADGAVFHCASAEFRPGAALSDLTWQKHQACVQMMEADYCADGLAHTFAGTPIYVRDISAGGAPSLVEADILFSPTQPAPPPPAGPYFEAAWLAPNQIPGGPIRTQRPACLSKLRWQTLPPGAGCGVPDPRFQPDAIFCDDYDLAHMSAIPGARVYNKSSAYDTGLYEWTNTTTGGYLTTVDGYWPNVAPLGGYWNAVFVGVLLRAIPPAFTAADMHEVHLYTNGFSYALASTAPPGYAATGNFQGFVFNTAQPNTVPLVRYVNGSLSRTLVNPPGGVGWTAAETVGHIYP